MSNPMELPICKKSTAHAVPYRVECLPMVIMISMLLVYTLTVLYFYFISFIFEHMKCIFSAVLAAAPGIAAAFLSLMASRPSPATKL